MLPSLSAVPQFFETYPPSGIDGNNKECIKESVCASMMDLPRAIAVAVSRVFPYAMIAVIK